MLILNTSPDSRSKTYILVLHYYVCLIVSNIYCSSPRDSLAFVRAFWSCAWLHGSGPIYAESGPGACRGLLSKSKSKRNQRFILIYDCLVPVAKNSRHQLLLCASVVHLSELVGSTIFAKWRSLWLRITGQGFEHGKLCRKQLEARDVAYL